MNEFWFDLTRLGKRCFVVLPLEIPHPYKPTVSHRLQSRISRVASALLTGQMTWKEDLQSCTRLMKRRKKLRVTKNGDDFDPWLPGLEPKWNRSTRDCRWAGRTPSQCHSCTIPETIKRKHIAGVGFQNWHRDRFIRRHHLERQWPRGRPPRTRQAPAFLSCSLSSFIVGLSHLCQTQSVRLHDGIIRILL